MDHPDNDKASSDATEVVIDVMRPSVSRGRKDYWGDAEPARQQPRVSMRSRRPEHWPGFLALGALLFGLAGFGFSGWIYVQGQSEVLRLSTELAQLRVGLDLYARNGANTAGLSDLGERLAALERAALSDEVPMPVAPATGMEAATAPAPRQEDCLPEGMRLLVAAGDSYPLCGQPAEVAVSFVDNGYITLSDGTSVASGGTSPLPGLPACIIAVTSGGDEGLTGYAEIRVNC